MKKLVSLFVLSLLFSAVFVLFLPAKTLQASEPINITIKPDGTIEPKTDLLEKNTTTYTLKDNLLGSIMVQKSSITLDGAGFTISKPKFNNLWFTRFQ